MITIGLHIDLLHQSNNSTTCFQVALWHDFGRRKKSLLLGALTLGCLKWRLHPHQSHAALCLHKTILHTRTHSKSHHQLSARKQENVSYLSCFVSARHPLLPGLPGDLHESGGIGLLRVQIHCEAAIGDF